MPRVYLSFDDIGLGIQFVDAFEADGYEVAWPRTPGGVPPADLEQVPDAVILGAADNDVTLGKWVRSWRVLDPPPAILVISRSEELRSSIESLRAIPVSPAIEAAELRPLAKRAIELRYMAELSTRFALRALGVKGIDDSDRAATILDGSRNIGAELVREALRPRIHDYISTTTRIDDLRSARAISAPELEIARSLDGSITVSRAIDRAADAAMAARVVWALVCIGAAKLTNEPPDQSTPARRAVSRARHHLRERQRRLRRGKSHYTDVLDVPLDSTPAEVDDAAFRLGVRFSPRQLGHLDLGDQSPYVAPLWAQIEKARAMLRDRQSCEQYDAWLATKGVDLAVQRIERPTDRVGAEQEFLAGQRALSRSDVKKAISFFAAAARKYPGHADYESYLAWARYRESLDNDEDKLDAAMRERTRVEEAHSGRPPRPRALLALALLCAASEDPGAAAWYLDEALTCDPQFELAKQIRARLAR